MLFDFLTGHEEVFISYDINQYQKYVQALQDNGIRYYTKMPRRRVKYQHLDYNRPYHLERRVFVKKKDVEEAVYILNNLPR
ncbi:MAG: hypothetical protein E7225_05410 [Clostridiales bacterium]|nr:hypothetical protein [Clostridiales bacterium]